MYCQSCGQEVADDAAYCDGCGEQLGTTQDDELEQTQGADAVTTEASTDREASPLWSIAVLGFTWVFFLFGFGGLQSGGTLIGGLATIAVILCIPILWLDARAAIRADELSTSRPIYIVIAVYLLYLLTMPIYVGYRLYKRSQQS